MKRFLNKEIVTDEEEANNILRLLHNLQVEYEQLPTHMQEDVQKVKTLAR